MKNSFITKGLAGIAMAVLFTANAQSQTKKSAKSDDVLKQIKELTAANEIISKNLATFDTLDYTVFSNRDWKRLHESHAKDIIVHFPDGHSEKGIEQHIKTLDAMFVYAPDTRIKEHPIKIGSGNITAVMGYMEGTFTQPMPLGDGTFIQPTGKKFKLPMATIGIWKADGTMSEEFLFWDNKSYMDQIMAK
ncbi:ester cyclase [Cloacibacterium sp.]|uniref:ester cyclase n=1 Tax=Cloacibacterium sp. TaxID=1913682 RepID=UPI0039E25CE8